MSALTTFPSTVDVVIPAYNADAYISQTLESVAKQTYPINSIIVVNDGSTDETQIRVLEFATAHPSLKTTLLNQANLGLSTARNTGIKNSYADYIALLDADDLWAPEKLLKQMQVFTHSAWPKLGVVYCAYQVVNEQGLVLASNSRDVICPSLRGNIYKELLLGNFISGSGSSVLIKRSVFSDVGLFDQDLRACEDWDMWMRIAKQFQFDFINDTLVSIRVHQNNMQKDSMRMLSAELMVLNKFFDQGDENTFLLWKIRTFLLNKGLSASAIPGFENCNVKLQSQLLGWRMNLAAAIASPFRALANIYLSKQKKR
jgi:glycosyltransferase involved in cell wall biosynthesis